MNDTTVLLVGHGSRNVAGNQEIEDFAAQCRQRHPDWRIEVCFIEYAEVLLEAGLRRACSGARRVVVLPLILNAAGHVKMEVPAAVARARAAHPDVEIVCTPHLGMGREVFSAINTQLRQLMQALDMPDPQTTGVILLGRGSSDAGANGELARMCRWVFEESDHELVDLAFTSITWPRLETVVQRHIRLGMMQLCIVPVYLFSGVLIDRIEAQLARLRQQYPHISFALGQRFGFDDAIFELVQQRVHGLQHGGLLECDGCRYRTAAEAEHLHEHGHTHSGHHHEMHEHAPHVHAAESLHHHV